VSAINEVVAASCLCNDGLCDNCRALLAHLATVEADSAGLALEVLNADNEMRKHRARADRAEAERDDYLRCLRQSEADRDAALNALDLMEADKVKADAERDAWQALVDGWLAMKSADVRR
jgi:hypothetical protein